MPPSARRTRISPPFCQRCGQNCQVVSSLPETEYAVAVTCSSRVRSAASAAARKSSQVQSGGGVRDAGPVEERRVVEEGDVVHDGGEPDGARRRSAAPSPARRRGELLPVRRRVRCTCSVMSRVRSERLQLARPRPERVGDVRGSCRRRTTAASFCSSSSVEAAPERDVDASRSGAAARTRRRGPRGSSRPGRPAPSTSERTSASYRASSSRRRRRSSRRRSSAPSARRLRHARAARRRTGCADDRCSHAAGGDGRGTLHRR